ncbi:MAG: hypothetical protein MI892_30630 [Desulfobacterales bacterium]|nr:hypothetical protein [Desulfobacterales bacterium]
MAPVQERAKSNIHDTVDTKVLGVGRVCMSGRVACWDNAGESFSRLGPLDETLPNSTPKQAPGPKTTAVSRWKLSAVNPKLKKVLSPFPAPGSPMP